MESFGAFHKAAESFVRFVAFTFTKFPDNEEDCARFSSRRLQRLSLACMKGTAVTLGKVRHLNATICGGY